jgi:hypothetical protein
MFISISPLKDSRQHTFCAVLEVNYSSGCLPLAAARLTTPAGGPDVAALGQSGCVDGDPFRVPGGVPCVKRRGLSGSSGRYRNA